MNLTLLIQNLRSALVWLRTNVELATLAGQEPEGVPVPVPARRPSAYAKVIGYTLGLSLIVLASQASAAQWQPISNTTARGQLVSVQMLVDGSTAPLYQRRGAWDRSYFEAFAGRNYSIRLRNLTSDRIGVLITVDGINVVNGERTSLGNNEAMYVLDPYESTSIRGWRTSLNEVRRFVFVDEERSYASRTDQANGDMGWIRVVTFTENKPLREWGHIKSLYRGGDGGGSAPYNSNPPSTEEPRAQDGVSRRAAPNSAHGDEAKGYADNESAPGTGWGQRTSDPVNRTVFNANANSTDMIVLRYEYESGLRALGIYPRRDRNRTWERENGDLGFAKPPRW